MIDAMVQAKKPDEVIVAAVELVAPSTEVKKKSNTDIPFVYESR